MTKTVQRDIGPVASVFADRGLPSRSSLEGVEELWTSWSGCDLELEVLERLVDGCERTGIHNSHDFVKQSA